VVVVVVVVVVVAVVAVVVVAVVVVVVVVVVIMRWMVVVVSAVGGTGCHRRPLHEPRCGGPSCAAAAATLPAAAPRQKPLRASVCVNQQNGKT
jgi:hypothetical protein